MAEATTTRMTLAEFKQLPETTAKTELLNGELIVSPAPVDAHQGVSFAVLAYFVRRDIPGILRHAPADLYIGGEDVPQPDIFWISPDNDHCRVINKYWHGAPDLVIESLSPSTAKYDRGDKYRIYERYAVREYWLIDPELLFIEVYTLENNRFVRRGVFGTGETFTSSALSIEVDVTALLGE